MEGTRSIARRQRVDFAIVGAVQAAVHAAVQAVHAAVQAARAAVHQRAAAFFVVTVVAMIAGGLGACSFAASLPGESGGDPGIDPPGMGGTDVDAAMPGVAPCRTPDTNGLVVCFEFEDSVSDGVLDDSSPARLHATSAGVTQVPRDANASSMVVDVGPDARTYVAQRPALDLAAAYTLSAWVRPDSATPAGSARGILDHEGQYAMIQSTTATGAIHNRCQHSGVTRYEWTARLPVGTWSFVACTWNGSQLCALRWSSPTDHEHYCHTAVLGPNATGAHGLAVGHLSYNGEPHSRFDGALDSVQVYGRALGADQLCALIGQPAGCLPCDLCQ